MVLFVNSLWYISLHLAILLLFMSLILSDKRLRLAVASVAVGLVAVKFCMVSYVYKNAYEIEMPESSDFSVVVNESIDDNPHLISFAYRLNIPTDSPVINMVDDVKGRVIDGALCEDDGICFRKMYPTKFEEHGPGNVFEIHVKCQGSIIYCTKKLKARSEDIKSSVGTIFNMGMRVAFIEI